MICGTLAPSEGSIITKGSIAALLELGSGFNPEFTGIENVFLNASLLGQSYQQTESRLDEIKAFADIGDFIDHPVKTYSSGMIVRLAFAVVAHVNPSILVVDEALSVGDAVFVQRCMRFIRKFSQEGTLLFVSHDLNSVSSLCQRALWIDSGQLKVDDNNSATITAYTRCCQQSSDPGPDKKKGNSSLSQPHDYQIKQLNHRSTIEFPIIEQIKQKSNHTHEPPQKAPTAASQANIADWNEGYDYGNRNSIITEVSLKNSLGEPTSSPRCGENVLLSITAHCINAVDNLMAGFIVRDKTGTIIWGENNIHHCHLKANAGISITISFTFTMPFIKPGSYALSVAISEKSVDVPTVMHYKPDALVIEPLLGTQPVHGIFAIPNTIVLSEIIP
jgi:lipopolysaccharide transport system ATP-binding protein